MKIMEKEEKKSKGSCESCMMPFSKDTGSRENEKYCSYCFANGKLCYEGTEVKEFKRVMIEAIVARGEPKWKARIFAFMAGFAPRWKGQNSFLGKIFGNYGENCEEKKK